MAPKTKMSWLPTWRHSRPESILINFSLRPASTGSSPLASWSRQYMTSFSAIRESVFMANVLRADWGDLSQAEFCALLLMCTSCGRLSTARLDATSEQSVAASDLSSIVP
eukprot:Blabericola_migrator_1__3159@NODE_1922_length_3555_cov_190_978211_g1229_i0_p4_GENE_NODE_1922_length_3555_cov_190_978211_g1229_i0NODE_1922_length_3555_cov_190_978211_g1229_i0_p4_ORF_typecomplete_len110_score21_50LAvirus_coat/PF09220_10/0_11_NODE_1922_length_3555_cov_190_978211_g1229_i021572486